MTNLNNQYISNYSIWSMDETKISDKYGLMLIVDLKTRVIIGHALKEIDKDMQNKKVQNKETKAYYSIVLDANDICKLFEHVLFDTVKPVFIHMDNNPVYKAQKIVKFLKKENGIGLSFTADLKHGNQLSESINNVIKQGLIKIIHKQNNKPYKEFTKQLPNHLKQLKIQNKVTNNEYKRLFFNSEFFNKNINVHHQINQIIQQYNQKKNTDISDKYSKEELHILDQHVTPYKERKASKATKNALQIKEQNNKTWTLVKDIRDIILENKNLSNEKKQEMLIDLDVLQVPQAVDEYLMDLKYLASQEQQPVIDAIIVTYKSQLQYHQKTQEYVVKLEEEIKKLQKQNANITKENADISKKNADISKVVEQLNEYLKKIEQEQQIKKYAREKRLARKRRAQTQPLMKEHYYLAIEEIKVKYDDRPKTKIQMILILTLFILTGVRVSELRHIKIYQILHLLQNYNIPIDRLKRGHANKKAFLTKSGKKILNETREFFYQHLFLTGIKVPEKPMKDYNYPPFDELYFFSSEKSKGKKPYSRSYFNNAINKTLQNLEVFQERGYHFTSHSLRHGFIHDLWSKTQDIQFVSQAIGHLSISSTSIYTHELSDDVNKK